MVPELLQEMSVPPPEIFRFTSPVLTSKSPSNEAREEDELADDNEIESKDLSELQ